MLEIIIIECILVMTNKVIF